MTTSWKISNFIVLAALIIICALGTFYKPISLGLGLGDSLGYIILYGATLLHLVLTLAWKKNTGFRHMALTLVFSTFTLLFSLYATLWRGHEYRWNGSLFYEPCATTVEVRNAGTNKKILVQMCSMEYYSEFVGTWDGKQWSIKEGTLKIPGALEAYIKRPITVIEILPGYSSQIENDSIIHVPRFIKDTLQLNQAYAMAGEIIAIKDYRPVVRVTIR